MVQRSRMLVIGGGFAGASLAVMLAENPSIDVTLVSSTEFFEVAFANARTVVEPDLADRAIWPYKDMKPHGTFIQGTVVDLTDSTAALQDGRVLKFDFAAIATGSSYAVGKAAAGDAITTEQRREEVKALARKVKAAASVLVVGGGPLGVELAGEILTDLPGVKVTLVHSGASLLPSLPAKLGTAAEAWLKGKGCQVILNDRIDLPAGASGGPFSGTTRAGVAVSCDMLLAATGVSYNTTFMQPHLANALDTAGMIKVDPQLRVVGHPRLFALGDAADVPQEKLAFLAAQQAAVVAANLNILAAAAATAAHTTATSNGTNRAAHTTAASNGTNWAAAAPAGAGGKADGQDALRAASSKMKSWKPSMGMQVLLVSVGRNYGVGRIGWLALTGWLPTWLKSRNIVGFTDKYRQQLLMEP